MNKTVRAAYAELDRAQPIAGHCRRCGQESPAHVCDDCLSGERLCQSEDWTRGNKTRVDPRNGYQMTDPKLFITPHALSDKCLTCGASLGEHGYWGIETEETRGNWQTGCERFVGAPIAARREEKGDCGAVMVGGRWFKIACK